MQSRRTIATYARVAQIRNWIVFALLSVASPMAIAQSLSDEKAEESLLASTWAGDILGVSFVGYLLDETLLVTLAGEQKPRFERWNIRDGKFIARVKLSERSIVGLRAEVRGNVMVGTTDDGLGHISPFELRRQATADKRLLAAAPPGRPYPAPPLASATDFAGTYEITLPEKGKDGRRMKATLNCRGEACTFAMGNDIGQTYDRLDPIRRSNFGQAKFALKYAKEHKDNAKKEAPYLSALLDSDAGIHSCINLGYKNPRFSGADIPGLTILCKLDRSPWNKPVVLHMGSILSNCGNAFCRYGMIPMFRQDVAARATVSTSRYVGSWEYKDQGSAVRLTLDEDGSCTIVAGGGIAGRCRYSEKNGLICINEFSDLRGNAPAERMDCGIKFSYEGKTDTISMQGESPIRLLRAATPPARP